MILLRLHKRRQVRSISVWMWLFDQNRQGRTSASRRHYERGLACRSFFPNFKSRNIFDFNLRPPVFALAKAAAP